MKFRYLKFRYIIKIFHTLWFEKRKTTKKENLKNFIKILLEIKKKLLEIL